MAYRAEFETEQDDICYNFDVGDEYDLNHFLSELAKEITEEELKVLKFYIGGRGGSGKATLEGITDALDYFNHLRQKDLLSMENICILEAFIWHLGRKDLYKKMVDFGRRFEKQTLYFYAPRDTPENGYKYVKFHVKGKVGRANVEKIHLGLAKVLRVPIEFVSIAGIEKTNSIIITLMVPEECVMTLSTLTDKEKSTLDQLCIDNFTLGETRYSVTGIDIAEDMDEVDEEIIAVQKLIENDVKMKKELDSCHAANNMYKRKIKELSKFNEQKVAETTKTYFLMHMAMVAFKNDLLKRISENKIPAPLMQQASLQHFGSLMERAKELDIDRRLLNEILEYNGIIVKTRVTVAYQMLIQQQQLEIEMANATILQFQYMIQRLSFLLKRNLKETEGNWNSVEFLQYVALQKALPILSNISIEIPTMPIDDETLKRILFETSKELKQEEKNTLLKSIQMDQEEKQRYKQDKNKLLEIIMLKTRKPNVPFNVGEFVYHNLQKVNRPDLIRIFHKIVNEMQAMNQPRTRGNDGKDDFSTAHEQPREKQTHESYTEQYCDINSRLQKMEEMIEKLVKMSASNYQSKMSCLNDTENNKLAAQLFFSQRYAPGLQ